MAQFFTISPFLPFLLISSTFPLLYLSVMSPYNLDFSAVSGQQQNSGYQSHSPWMPAKNRFLPSGSRENAEITYRALQDSYNALKETNSNILAQLKEKEQDLMVQK
jgi:hypothetical protein